MKRSYLSTATVVTLVPLALITLQSCGIVRAAEAFNKYLSGALLGERNFDNGEYSYEIIS
jgi:hypothetical protein